MEKRRQRVSLERRRRQRADAPERRAPDVQHQISPWQFWRSPLTDQLLRWVSGLNTLRFFNHHVHARYPILAASQFIVLVGCMMLARRIYLFMEGVPVTESYWLQAIAFASVTVLGQHTIGLYRRHRRDQHLDIIVRVLISFLLAAIGLAAIYYVFPVLDPGGAVLWRAVLLALAVTMALRLTSYWLFKNRRPSWRVLFLGAGRDADLLLTQLRRSSDRRLFHHVGCVPIPGETPQVDTKLVCEDVDDLLVFAREQRVTEIVVAMDDERQHFPASKLMACRFAGINVIDKLTFYERQTGKIKIELLRPDWLIYSHGFRSGGFQDAVKRGFDLTVALILLVAFWPLMLLTALAIKLEDGFSLPVLFRQARVGRGGAVFHIFKFRSMRVDAEANGAQWASVNDARVTRVGKFIRKTRLDELPQLVNVIQGNMSLVGPRPERPEFVTMLAQRLPYYRVREQVKPGLTGWAQIGYPYGASEEDARGKLRFDLYYVKNRSLFLDFLILLGTIEIIFFRRGGR